MKSHYLIVLSFLLSAIGGAGCKSQPEKEAVPERQALDQEAVTVFARQMIYSVTHGDATFCNDAFDQKGIKAKISENSLVNSSMDTDFGKEFLDYNFHYGDQWLKVLEQGGDVSFQKYYEKDGEHHILLRTYQDFGIKIEDFIVDTVDNQLKITDGFLYNVSTTFSNYVKYVILYNVLQKTDPEGSTRYFVQCDELLNSKKEKEALKLLEDQRELLQEYPFYTQQILHAAFMANPATFPDFLKNHEGLDERSRLTHLLLYYANGGYVDEAEKVIEELIKITGDDPVYLFFFARTNLIAKKYGDALLCLDNLTNAFPPLWDVWQTRAECLYHLDKKDEFVDNLLKGCDLYGLTDEELQTIVKNKYPKMLNPLKTALENKKSEEKAS